MKFKTLTFLFIFYCTSLLPQDADSVTFISLKPAGFNEELGIVNRPVIIDVREFFEFRRNRLPGAINIPSSGNIEEAIDTLNRAGYYFLYCTTDYRSIRAARKLTGNNFIHVFNLEGGLAAWKKEGLPLDRKRVRKKSNR